LKPKEYSMPVFLRYLASLVLHMAWRRAGRGGPIPPMRLPGKGKRPVDLPVIGTWQLMAAMWLFKRLWARYGNDVRTHLMNNSNDLARRAASYLPGVVGAATAGTATPGTATTPGATNTPSTGTTPTVSSAHSPAPAAPAPRPTPAYNTQPLQDDSNPQSDTNTGNLPQGSILSKLRGKS
jgi:hypothetical protein